MTLEEERKMFEERLEEYRQMHRDVWDELKNVEEDSEEGILLDIELYQIETEIAWIETSLMEIDHEIGEN